jgi:hypothetical protein
MSFNGPRLLRAFVCTCVMAGVAELLATPQSPTRRESPHATDSTILDQLPLDFIVNSGQWQPPARFVASHGAVRAAFEPHAIRLALGHDATTRLSLVFEGAANTVTIAGEGRRSTVYNFIVGSDPSRWQFQVPAYRSVFYRGMYDGVDVRVREGAGRFEYDLLVAPGTDLRQVVIRADGATRVELDADGQLVLQTPGGRLTQTPPDTSEVLPNGESRRVESRFRIIDEHHYGFEAPARDAALPLVVDPGLVWSSFTGGTGGKTLAGIEMARDGSGDIFLSGITSSPDFSTTPLSSQWTSRQHSFVARVSAGGDALRYLTFISGLAGQTFAGDLAGDSGGGVIVVGSTADRDLPTTAGAFQRNNANTNLEALDGDGFVTRLDAFGSLVFSTYLGGALNDMASDVRLDPSGQIIVAGTTRSSNFPTTAGAYDTTFNTPPAGDNTAFPEDMFISRLSANGSQLTYSTFFGGQTYEIPTDMVVDANGVVTIGGVTTSSSSGRDIPITPGAFDSTWNGSDDGFIARFKLDGQGTADLKYSTFLGGINIESLDGVALDPVNPELVTVAGWSWVDVFTTPRFPTTAGSMKPALTPNPPASALFPHVKSGFVTRFRFPAAGGGSLVWSTFVGGNFDDMVHDVAVDESGAAIVIGATRSYDLTTTRGALDRTMAGAAYGAYDCFVQKISPDGAQLLYSTFLGGRGEDCDLTGFTEGRLVYVGGNTIAVAGVTDSPDLSTTAGAMVPTVDEVSNSRNLFVAKLHLAADASGDVTASPPTLLSPPNSGLTDYGSVVRFSWSDVPDPSGIEAYVLEASTKPDFPANFTQYRVSSRGSELILEALATTIPWYWRVRTADRAGNLSDWSATNSFTTGLSNSLPSVSMVQIYPTSIVGGQSPLGVIHLTKPAPPGGAVVALSVKDGRGFTQTVVPLAVPETITVPEGAISANLPVNTSAVPIATPVSLYATIAGIGAKGTVSVGPPAAVKASSLSLNPLTVTGGNPVVATVTLTGPAPAGGHVVPLFSQYPEFVSLPASITIPAGAMSGSFSIATSPVPFALNSWIEAAGATAATLSLKTAGVRMTGLTLSASTATGGTNVTGTVTFSGPIPATPAPSTSGAIVKLTTSSPAVALAPLIVVPVGASSMTFGMNVQNVPVTTPVNIVASYDDTALTKTLTIPGSSLSLASLTVNVSTLTGGQGGVGTVTLSGPAPSGHVLVSLSANNPAVSLPPNVFVSAGSSSGIFSFGAFPVTTTTPATISAAFGSSTASTGITINPGVTVGVTSLTLSPSTVAAGSSSTGTVTLSGPAPSSGAVVQLSGASPATLPSTVTVPAGATSATFTVGTTSTTSTKQATIHALLNTTWGAVLTVTAGSSTPPPTLSSISLSPSTVVGGNTSQGTATLTSAAPSGGTLVSLSSSNTSAATVPSSITIAAGSTSRTFTVTTSTVTASTPVTISGSSGAARTATLTVTPAGSTAPAAPSPVSPANGSTVALPIALDWTDVSAAASYQLQIDDSSAFSAPQVVEQTVTSSQFTVTSLATQQHWWRVRGVNAAGTAGAWSSVRSFTPQGPPPPPGSAVTVTVTASGRSGERITSSPAGISVAVGSTASASFNAGTAITLTVSNGRDAVWSGACSSSGSKTRTCRFTPTANASVTANVQ